MMATIENARALENYRLSGIKPQVVSTENCSVKAVLKQGATNEPLHDKTAALAVSITSRPEDEDKIIASIEMIGRTFHACAIVLGDSLARHTIAIENGSDCDSGRIARQIGRDWAEKYRPIIEQQSIPIRLIHWDHWLEKKDFAEKKNLILSLYYHDQAFQDSVHEFVDEYIQRRQFQDSNTLCARDNCLEYAIEELTVMLFLAHEGWDYILYPSTFPTPLLMIIDRWIKPFFQHGMQSRPFRYRSVKRA